MQQKNHKDLKNVSKLNRPENNTNFTLYKKFTSHTTILACFGGSFLLILLKLTKTRFGLYGHHIFTSDINFEPSPP